MDPVLSSTLLLTSLMGIGLGFFLRAASKDRTTTVDVNSSRPPVEVLDGLNHWLLARGWQARGGDPERQVMRFEGAVASSLPLAVLLSSLGAVGAASLVQAMKQPVGPPPTPGFKNYENNSKNNCLRPKKKQALAKSAFQSM